MFQYSSLIATVVLLSILSRHLSRQLQAVISSSNVIIFIFLLYLFFSAFSFPESSFLFFSWMLSLVPDWISLVGHDTVFPSCPFFKHMSHINILTYLFWNPSLTIWISLQKIPTYISLDGLFNTLSAYAAQPPFDEGTLKYTLFILIKIVLSSQIPVKKVRNQEPFFFLYQFFEVHDSLLSSVHPYMEPICFEHFLLLFIKKTRGPVVTGGKLVSGQSYKRSAFMSDE